MANSLEIFQNTLLKLVVRSGSDSDRKNITLDIGEPGYTTDTKRLYVGDGVTQGGVLVGNLVLDDVATFASIPGTVTRNDIVYHTGNSTLYRYVSGTPTLSGSWSTIGRVVKANNNTIVVNSDSSINVGTLSANNFSNDAVTGSITLSTGRIALSSDIAVNKIFTRTNTYLELPRNIQAGSVTYVFPASGATVANSMLISNLTGGLSWQAASSLLSASSATLVAGPNIYFNVNNSATNSTSALLLTSGRVEVGFDGFIPVAHATFKQDATILRNVGISSVTSIPRASVTSNNTNFTSQLQTVTTPYDSGFSGAYLVTLSTDVSIVSSVVDISIKNATFDYVSLPIIIDQNLSYSYFYGPDLGGGRTNQIYVYIYTKTFRQIPDVPGTGQSFIGLNLSNNRTRYSSYKPILTPGSQNNNTRFSISVYE